MGCCWQKISNTSEHIDDISEWVEFEDDWFAQGPCRLTYRGAFHGDHRREGKRCAVKVYKEEWYEDQGQFAWKVDNIVYDKAQEMAKSFNSKFKTSKQIEFVKPEFTHVNTLATFTILWFNFGFKPFERKVKGKQEGTTNWVSSVIPQNASLAVERYLEGEFVKFSSNSGYVNPGKGSSSSAFSHYTYHASDGEMLVCDLQGVRSDTGYMFTSPAIHSGGAELGVYGPTDLGKFGIVKFFKNHTCNVLCTGLSKPKLITDSPNEERLVNTIVDALPDDYCSSTYISQLSKLTRVPLNEIKLAQSKSKLVAVTK